MKDKAINEAMKSIENHIRSVYNQGYEDGKREAEKKNELQLFDEVLYSSFYMSGETGVARPGVVVSLYADEAEVLIGNRITHNWYTARIKKEYLVKTGNNYPQMADVLQQLGGTK